MRKKVIIFISILLGAIFVRFVFNLVSTHIEQTNRKKTAMPEIVVEQVRSQSIIRHYESPARVVPKYQVDVDARTSGYLQKSYFREGDYIKQGQILFEIEPEEYQFSYQQAKANLASARAKQVYYDKQCLRAQQLVQKDYIARSEYDNAVAQRDSYRADVARSVSAYNDAKRNLSYTKIKAPVSGRIGMIRVTVGNYVTMNVGALTTINSINPIYVTFPLEANDYNELVRIDGGTNVKRRVEYIFSSGKKYEFDGVQDFYDNKIDESTGTITMRATFNNKNSQLFGGDYGKAIIYSNKTDPTPIIPTKAIQENQVGKYVYKVDANGIPTLVYIKVLEHKGDYTLLSSGLEIGDMIAVGGLQQIVPGVQAKIVNYLPQENQKKQNIFIRLLKKIKRMLKGRG